MTQPKLDELPPILTAQHISTYLQISRRRVYELFQTKEAYGGIPNFDIGASKRVKKESFTLWIEAQVNRKASNQQGG